MLQEERTSASSLSILVKVQLVDCLHTAYWLKRRQKKIKKCKVFKCKTLLVFSCFADHTSYFWSWQMCITFAKTRQNYLFTFNVPRAELCLFHSLLLLCCWFCCSELFTGSFHLHATQMQAELSESKAETRLYNLNRLMTFSFPRPLEMLCIILICFFCPVSFTLLVCCVFFER